MNHGYFSVVESVNRIVAPVGIYKLSDEVCELRKMYALSSQQGQGLGRKLIGLSISKVKELGFNHIVLETASPLKETISPYKKFGFTKNTPDHLSSRCDQALVLYL